MIDAIDAAPRIRDQAHPAVLSDPTRVRLLHAVATSHGGMTVGELTELPGISQSTASHHVRKLADARFVHVAKVGTSTRVTVNEACCTGLPHMAEVVMGMTAANRPCCPDDIPADVSVRELRDDDWADVRRIYRHGIDTGIATFETSVPPSTRLAAAWLPGHRWVAEIDGALVGWTSISPVSDRGVGETSVYVDSEFRGRGVGKALLRRQVTAADNDEIWTLQTSIFTENPRQPHPAPPGRLPHRRHPRAHRPARRHPGTTPSCSSAAGVPDPPAGPAPAPTDNEVRPRRGALTTAIQASGSPASRRIGQALLTRDAGPYARNSSTRGPTRA
ncbi:L-amino acid N-acyltransferase YncA/DNA-binding transcriptional ArsR family regulator [Jiangella mangrovi]|uniref:L-amino acid N-acyltransferase YncA/DNA-binding transcriptional ArsR family regulator n=1 Tax=Jiangella mangrovi TaxID=1524084 RepID=A0A7W9GUS6_9ACTN|nr:L-amino acid N-acyltransferase YncA/DNA-binding transcriptional ArsR family regulator [Jiangella mangrovi]